MKLLISRERSVHERSADFTVGWAHCAHARHNGVFFTRNRFFFTLTPPALFVMSKKGFICLFFDHEQGCGAGTEISDSGSRHLYFLAPAPTSLWLRNRLQNDLVHWKLKTIVLFVQVACPTNMSVEQEPEFQVLAPPSKIFRVRLQPSKIAWAPVPQSWPQHKPAFPNIAACTQWPTGEIFSEFLFLFHSSLVNFMSLLFDQALIQFPAKIFERFVECGEKMREVKTSDSGFADRRPVSEFDATHVISCSFTHFTSSALLSFNISTTRIRPARPHCTPFALNILVSEARSRPAATLIFLVKQRPACE